MEGERSKSASPLKCILCMRSNETDCTGPLSSKKGISAHQNCLLFASGIFCKFSPTFDDLFGFDVADVNDEYRRGRKLRCHQCKKKGATAGCEVKACKRSYHYPCTEKAQAASVENSKGGIYTLYCPKHNPNAKSAEDGPSEVASGSGDPNNSEASEMENSFAESESDGDITAVSGDRKRKRSIYTSDSDDNESPIDHAFAPLDEDPEEPVAKQMIGPTMQTPVPENERNDEEPKPSTSDASTPSDIECGDETCVELNNESPSLLAPEYRHDDVLFTVIADSGPSEASLDPYSPAPAVICDSPPSHSAAEQDITFHNDTTIQVNPLAPGCPPNNSLPPKSSDDAPHCSSDENPSVENSHTVDQIVRPASRDRPLDLTAPAGDLPFPVAKHTGEMSVPAALFWRRCNELGCTENIFMELRHQLSSLADRVQNEHATQQDYTVSLRILEASGRLPEIFQQLEQDLEEQERKLCEKREALRNAKAALGPNCFM
ncbi:uncharacterized protein phf11 isoform X2 [Trichomycterus rosablanca]|uniref:uncharacterized protein phf11 isoform X2 n=1 Tax=Trichomycterus rosablanca TaxID=2290929 RepID=UPI002F357E7E